MVVYTVLACLFFIEYQTTPLDDARFLLSLPVELLASLRTSFSHIRFFFCSYLNGFGPLQIGGVQTALSSLFPKISFGGFRGCIRDITDNGLTYDLLNPLLQVNTELGCKLDNNACPDCNGHGYCEPLWTNSICVCDLGYTGPNCNQSK